MNRLLVPGVPLEGDLAELRAGTVRILSGVVARKRNDIRVDRVLLAVQVAHEFGNPALVVEDRGLPVALVPEFDPHSPHQERQLADPVRNLLEVELGRLLEDRRIGKEVDERAAVSRFRSADALQRSVPIAPGEGLTEDSAVPPDLDPEPGGEGVHDGDADAVQASRVLVVVGVELSAGVEPGHDDFNGRKTGAGLGIHRDSPAVVPHRQAAVGVDRHFDLPAVATHRLVDAVVHDLPEEVVKPDLSRGPDVHRRADPDGLEPLENPDVLAGVALARRCGERCGRHEVLRGGAPNQRPRALALIQAVRARAASRRRSA